MGISLDLDRPKEWMRTVPSLPHTNRLHHEAHHVQSGLVLDAVVLKRLAIFQELAAEFQLLCVGWHAASPLPLYLLLQAIDCVGGLDEVHMQKGGCPHFYHNTEAALWPRTNRLVREALQFNHLSLPYGVFKVVVHKLLFILEDLVFIVTQLLCVGWQAKLLLYFLLQAEDCVLGKHDVLIDNPGAPPFFHHFYMNLTRRCLFKARGIKGAFLVNDSRL
mmetsp:Transcript_17908/g.40215  ORF Transcript_17908/g.40215 Transcript_17908/m.40215 type:complete len:219 (-) Transcript_17908:26-682(-)